MDASKHTFLISPALKKASHWKISKESMMVEQSRLVQEADQAVLLQVSASAMASS